MDFNAETVLVVLVVMMRFEIGVVGEDADDISSTSKCPFELVVPLVVIEILRPISRQMGHNKYQLANLGRLL